MIGQHGIKTKSKNPPVRYEAIEKCLATVADKARELAASVHMPRIGCGLAGGDWGEIEPLIERTLIASSIDVFVYDFG